MLISLRDVLVKHAITHKKPLPTGKILLEEATLHYPISNEATSEYNRIGVPLNGR